MTEKLIVNWIILMVCTLIILGYLCIFVMHIDFFCTRTNTYGTQIASAKNSKKKISIEYYNEYTKKIFIKEMNIPQGYRNNAIFNSPSIKIFYTKWFNQVYIEGIKNPRGGVLIFDVIAILIGIVGFWASFEKLFMKK
ncbi:MAG: hypothetical protein QM687_14410 [Ferruginibacter sp.]